MSCGGKLPKSKVQISLNYFSPDLYIPLLIENVEI